MIYADNTTPTALAARLAEYISDPSTIRVRVLDHFGRAPSLDQCRKLREKAVAKRKKVAEYHDRFKSRCMKHDGPYYLDVHGMERCSTCLAEKQEASRKRMADANARRLERLEAERKARQEEAERKAEEKRRQQQEWNELAAKATTKPVLFSEIARAVCEAFQIAPSELLGFGRARYYVDARTAIVRILRRNGASYPMIGRRLKRDHSSIVNLDHSYDMRVKRNPMIATVVERLS
jgi:chromosomal replication initiator protein